MELISRQQAIDAFNTNIDELVVAGKENADAVERYLNRVIDEIKQLPPIQPEPHTGHWEPVGMAEAVGGESAMWGSAIAYHKCSECREQALEENGEEKLSDFCPSCGAKMEGVDDE